jgi:hypothetical protein
VYHIDVSRANTRLQRVALDGRGVRIRFDGRRGAAYPVRTMPSRAIAKEIPARSSLSGRPVGLLSGFALSLLALLVLLAR